MWNYYGIAGIMIMVLTLVVMVCEYADHDEIAFRIKHPTLADEEGDFWVPAWFEYKHTWVQILARLCMAVSVVLMLIVSAGPYYDVVHQSLRAPFAYTYVLFWTAVLTYLWMQVIRLFLLLLMLLFYTILGVVEWIFGTDFLTKN